jgi:hypothetical protein
MGHDQFEDLAGRARGGAIHRNQGHVGVGVIALASDTLDEHPS